MDFDPEDQEIIRLLTKIKDAEEGYPEHMLVARRHHYLKRMGEISLGIPADLGVQNTAKDVKPSNISATTSTLVETALIVALIAEVSAVAYFYRDQLADFFRKAVLEPRVQEIAAPSVVPSSLEIQGMTPSPAWAGSVASETSWPIPIPTETVVTLTNTPIPGVINNSIATVTGGPGLLNSASTAEPDGLNSAPGQNNSGGNNANNGHHYGQTPKPERTKESGNNPPPKEDNDKPPKDNEDQPPKEDIPSGEKEDKPPKEDQPPKDNNDKPPKQ